MSQSANRLIVRVILVLGVLLFAGISIAPIIGAFNESRSSQSSNASNNKGAAPAVDQKTKLQDEVRGYELVLQREPENQTALKALLQARLQLLALGQGEIKDVIQPLEKLASLNPDQTKYAVLLAQAKQQMGDNEGAAQTLRAVLETKPGDMDALQSMVALQMSQKRPEAAIGLLQEALDKAPQANKIQPNSVDTMAIRVLMGNIHASQKRYGKAFEIYEQAIKSDSKDFRPIWAKALVLKEQGKIDEAKPLFAKAAALAPAQYKDEINKTATQTPAPTATATPTASPTP
ncbi:TPR repeat-containing protein [Calothrix sp. NIES-4071]|nr:TPR repeat-containing protein [Calothrix sp. NIES-4071]BAZ58452.1 TPR repeat-containing protein [Calothrix sp. NIES-4105]